MRPIILIFLTQMILTSPLWPQSAELWRPSNTSPTSSLFLVEVHQVSPGPGLRDVNNRGGWGGMLGFESGANDFSVRFLVEASTIPTQFADPINAGQKYTALTWGGGVDGLVHFGHRDLNLYALVGLHIDTWQTTITFDSTDSSESSSSGRLGFRAGLGLNAGPIFLEARFRITNGNLRVPSDQRGSVGSWSALELGAGLRIAF